VTASPTARGLLDTSTVIQLGRIEDPTVLPDEVAISAITLAELSVGPHVAKTARAYDALIAAIAIANGLPLYTCNPTDFDAVPQLDLRPVTTPRE
jgi:hypothetical protein